MRELFHSFTIAVCSLLFVTLGIPAGAAEEQKVESARGVACDTEAQAWYYLLITSLADLDDGEAVDMVNRQVDGNGCKIVMISFQRIAEMGSGYFFPRGSVTLLHVSVLGHYNVDELILTHPYEQYLVLFHSENRIADLESEDRHHLSPASDSG